MEVFIDYDGNLEAVPFLEKALEAWAGTRFADPRVIEPKAGEKYQIHRRVMADGLAKEDFYILADIDAVPEENYVISKIHKMIPTRPDFGIAYIRPLFDIGGRVRVIRKGLVEKWPQQETVTYDQEHGEAIVKAGKLVETWDIHYRHLPSLVEIVN